MSSGLHPYPEDIKTLTSMRYLAAVWVVIFHWKNYFFPSGIAKFPIFTLGFLGVDFFFILSGFVLAHVYMRRQREGRLDYWNFLTRRVARIYPMHFLMLVFMAIFGFVTWHLKMHFVRWDPTKFIALPPGELLREVIGNILMIHGWGAADSLHFNGPSWSISAEWFAYLTFPLSTALLLWGLRRPAHCLAVTVIGTLVYAGVIQLGLHRAVFAMTWNVGILRIIPGFLLGIAIYQFGERYTAGARAIPAFYAALAVTIVLVQLSVPLPIIVLSFGALICLAADSERNGGLKLMCRPFPILLGEVSYAVYMVHFGVGIALYDIVLRNWQNASWPLALALIGLGLALVTAVSWIAHVTFELPMRNWLNARASRIMNPFGARA